MTLLHMPRNIREYAHRNTRRSKTAQRTQEWQRLNILEGHHFRASVERRILGNIRTVGYGRVESRRRSGMQERWVGEIRHIMILIRESAQTRGINRKK